MHERFGPAPTKRRAHPVHLIDGEGVGIIIAAHPIVRVDVPLVRGVSERIEQMVKSSNAPQSVPTRSSSSEN